MLKYLEDFQIGDMIETAETEVTREMIISFAQQFDPQPMHLDEKAARDTVFGELVGSGWQTLALTMRLIVDARLLGDTPIVGAEFQETRFHGPIRPGEKLRATVEVTGIRLSKSRKDRGFLDVKVQTKNSQEVPLVTQRWSLVVPSISRPCTEFN